MFPFLCMTIPIYSVLRSKTEYKKCVGHLLLLFYQCFFLFLYIDVLSGVLIIVPYVSQTLFLIIRLSVFQLLCFAFLLSYFVSMLQSTIDVSFLKINKELELELETSMKIRNEIGPSKSIQHQKITYMSHLPQCQDEQMRDAPTC